MTLIFEIFANEFFISFKFSLLETAKVENINPTNIANGIKVMADIFG
tara:strand:+ start:388 stop:528 length:141 start_codon:yes stop_codon:yes gene_type:complete